MKTFTTIALFAGGLIVGALAMRLRDRQQDYMILMSKLGTAQVDAAFRAYNDAEWLAMFKLNESEQALAAIERNMEVEVGAIQDWENEKPVDEKTQKIRDGFLQGVKLYYESCPPKDDMAWITKFLSNLPDRNPKATGDSALYRLKAAQGSPSP